MVAHYRPPVPTTGTHIVILFHTSASEEKLSFGGEFLSATTFCESEMTEGVLILNSSYPHPSKIHVGIDESLFNYCGSTFHLHGMAAHIFAGVHLGGLLGEQIEQVSGVPFL